MTPASITSPFTHGKGTPSGALSMKPAAAETRTRTPVPSLDSSAWAPNRAVISIGAALAPGLDGMDRVDCSSPGVDDAIDCEADAPSLRRTGDLDPSSARVERIGQRGVPAP